VLCGCGCDAEYVVYGMEGNMRKSKARKRRKMSR